MLVLTISGNARASNRGSGQQIRLSRFCVYKSLESKTYGVSPVAQVLIMTLSDYYAYYDDVVSDWLEETLIPYEPFMPEPWWGWTPDSGHLLHAVVINLNPGVGGYPQSRQNIRSRLGNLFSYRRV